MNNAATYAGAWNLIPGIALTEAQMAQLTSDIVWLVEREITLPDGSRQKALVPQVYVVARQGDLHPSGALLGGDSVNLTLAGDLTNSGAIAGRSVVSLAAENIKNLGGRITGNQTSLTAKADIQNRGGRIEGGNSLTLQAGRDISIETTTQSSQNVVGASNFSRTNIDRVAGLYITNPGGTMIASAGRDLNLIGAEIINNLPPTAAGDPKGSITLSAQRDIKLGTVGTLEIDNSIRDEKHYTKNSFNQEVGSVIDTTGNLTLSAGQDIAARAASVTSSQGAINVKAERDLTIESGLATYDMESSRQVKKSGFMSSSKSVRQDTISDTSAISSTFSGDTVNLNAGRDLTLRGSNVVGAGDVTLAADNNLNIEAAEETHQETHYSKEKKTVSATLFL